jgi:hypothetical protein
MSDESAPDPNHVRALTEELGSALYQTVPLGASSLVFEFSQVGRGAEGFADGVVADGQIPVRLDRGVLDLAKSLRSAMYRPGVGTWFSAKITVTAEGSMDADFNYDDEPQWDEGVPAHWFVTDLERFPREDSAIPEWLKAKIAQAAS